MNRFKTIAIWTVLVLIFVVLYTMNRPRKPSYYQDQTGFLEDVRQGRVREVAVKNNELTVHLADGSDSYATFAAMDDDLTRQLSESGVRITWGEQSGRWNSLLLVLVPLVVLVALLLFVVRRMRGSSSGILQLGKSTARTLTEECKVSFADVGGCSEAKETLSDVVDFLRSPERWTNAGARLPRGVLLEGPPGCGKTLLARAVAGETNAKFYFLSASEFVELYVGVGAARVRDMFETAVREAPAVVFIDELDAVGRRRGSGVMPGHEEREQTLNQLLVCLDGFQSLEKVVVIAATNRSDIIDPALLRAGRFDRRIRIAELNQAERQAILRIHTQGKPIGDDVAWEELAELTAGYNGAQLESLANDAALQAVRRTRDSGELAPLICQDDFRAVLKQHSDAESTFNLVDSLLIESATQLAQPSGRIVVRVVRRGAKDIEGELLWADAALLKVRRQDDGQELVIPKVQVQGIYTVSGAAPVQRQDIQSDPWAAQHPQLA